MAKAVEAVNGAYGVMKDFYQQFTEALPSIAVAVVIFLIFLLAGFIVFWVFRARAKQVGKHEVVYNLLATVLRFTLISLGLICALGTVGISVSALVTSLGLAGFAIGLALKDVLSNTISGIFLIIHRPFKVGDHIQVKGAEGQVVEIGLRFTILHDNGTLAMVPNSVALQEVVTVNVADPSI